MYYLASQIADCYGYFADFVLGVALMGFDFDFDFVALGAYAGIVHYGLLSAVDSFAEVSSGRYLIFFHIALKEVMVDYFAVGVGVVAASAVGVVVVVGGVGLVYCSDCCFLAQYELCSDSHFFSD